MTATNVPDTPAPASYQFGTGSAAGVWLGLGAGRVALVGAGLTASILALTVGLPAGLAALPVLAAVTLAAVRVAGRPLTEWLAPAAGHEIAAFSGAARWTGPFPAAPTSRRADHGLRLRLPPEFGRLRLADCPDAAQLGLLIEASTRTVTVVFDVAGPDRFPLLEPADRDTLIVGWGQALAVLADTDQALVRLQVLERAGHPPAPIGPDPVGNEAPLPTGDRLARTIDALSTWHECRLAAQWSVPRLDAAGMAGIAGRCRTVSHTLLSARLATRPLSAAEIAADLTTGLSGQPTAEGWAGLPGPVSSHTSWTHVTIDETAHRCFAVTGWPRIPVAADWLAPLLLAAPPDVTRTVALHLQHLAPAAAARVARTARAKATLDQQDRLRLGMTDSAAIDRAAAGGVAMDEELAAGYRTHRLTGLVMLSGPSPAALDDATPALRAAAAGCRLDLQPLHGQHDRALAASLPLCRVRPRGQA